MRIWREYHFEAAHWLPLVADDHKCRRMHGHSYCVRLTLEGEPTDGMVTDFADVDRLWQQVHRLVDHRILNEVRGLDNPTSEELAAWTYRFLSALRPQLGKPGVTISSVEVSETARSGAVYP